MYVNTSAISNNITLFEAKKEETSNLYTALLSNIYNIQNRELKISLAVMTAKIIINLSNQPLCPLDKKLIDLANKIIRIINTPSIDSKDPLENYIHNDCRNISIWVGNSNSNSDLFNELFRCMVSCISDPNELFSLTVFTAKIIKNFPEKLDITVTNLAATVLHYLNSYSNIESSYANTNIDNSFNSDPARTALITSSARTSLKRKKPSQKKQRLIDILKILKLHKSSMKYGKGMKYGKSMKYEQITKETNCPADKLCTIYHNYFDSENNYRIGSKEWSPHDERRLREEYNKLKDANKSPIFPILATMFQTNPMTLKRKLRELGLIGNTKNAIVQNPQ